MFDGLPKREREILEIVYRLKEGTAREINSELGDGTSYSAVRTFLSSLESKGLVRFRREGLAYVWSPANDPEREGTSALADVAKTFFGGSRSRAIAALLGPDREPLSDDEYIRLKAMIEKAKSRE